MRALPKFSPSIKLWLTNPAWYITCNLASALLLNQRVSTISMPTITRV